MLCEKCNKEHDGKYGSGRFCCQSCSRSYSNHKKTKKSYEQISKKLKGKTTWSSGIIFPRQNYEIICETCGNIFFKEITIRYYNSNRYQKICIRCLEKNSIRHKQRGFGGNLTKEELYEIKKKCAKESSQIRLEKFSKLSWDEAHIAEKIRRVLKEQDDKCDICKTLNWNNKPLVFQLHHIDGNRFNNSRENLQYLCPNCHSQTDNFNSKKQQDKNITNEEFILALKSSKNIRQALIKLGLTPKSGNYDRSYYLLEKIKESNNEK